MISRRLVLALPFAAACSRRHSTGFSGYAFVANEEGKAVAAVDLQAFAVAKHISLDDAPTQVIASPGAASVYAVTPESGTVHEILADRLSFRRKLQVASAAPEQSLAASLSPDDRFLYVLSREPRALTAVATDSLKIAWRVSLPEEPVEFSLTQNGKHAAVSSGSSVRLLDLSTHELSAPLGHAEFGAVRAKIRLGEQQAGDAEHALEGRL